MSQNSTVHIVNERTVLKAFDMPEAPEGYRYDTTKSPPELVKERKRVTFDTTPKAKPSMEDQVDLLRADYSKAISTNETYKVP